MPTATFVRGAPQFGFIDLLNGLQLTDADIVSSTRVTESGTSGGRAVLIVYEGTGLNARTGTVNTITFFVAAAPGGPANTQIVTFTGLSLPILEVGEFLQRGAFNVIGSPEGDQLITGDGNDVFTLGAGDDIVNGSGGNDRIIGGTGDDFLVGGAGNDLLDGGLGNDVMLGGSGDDLFIGSLGTDGADGEFGRDRITFAAASQGATVVEGRGGTGVTQIAGIETVVGSNFADTVTVFGDSDIDTISTLAGDDTVSGAGGRVFLGEGNDTYLGLFNEPTLVNGGAGFDTVSGASIGGSTGVVIDLANPTPSANGAVDAAGRSVLSTTFVSIERVIATDGNDIVRGTAGNDILLGMMGNDILVGRAGDDALRGGFGDDLLVGGTGADLLVGGAGVDTVSYLTSAAGVSVDLRTGSGEMGDATGDRLFGIEIVVGSGDDDVLVGGAADETLLAAAGDDILNGRFGDDTLNGGVGNDLLLGGAGADVLIGGVGRDVVSYGEAAGGVTLDLRDATAGAGEAAGDRLFGVEVVVGSEGNDRLFGAAANDVLRGGEGDDVLTGRFGDDALFGGAGNDRLSGDQGADTLRGDAGTDTFVVTDTSEYDRIIDFEDGIDRIEVSAPTVNSFDDLLITQGTGFSTVRFADGTGGVTLVRLDGVTAAELDAGDFILTA